MIDPGRRRVVFVDQARSLAVALMLVGHSLDRFLGEPWRSGQTYQNYQFVRGLSSALFLMVAGFSFVIASFRYWDDYRCWSERMRARVRRIGLILFLGYVLHLWEPTLFQSLMAVDPDKWERFVRFDVLQNIGLSLILLHLALYVSRTPDRFLKIAAALLVGIVLAAVITYRPEVDAALPVEIGAMVNLYHYSRFPVVPLTGFTMAGALMGYWYWRGRSERDHFKLFTRVTMISLGLVAFELAIRHGLDQGIFPYSARLPEMPGNTFARAGCAMLIMSGLYFVGLRRQVLPRLSFILSKDSLAIYFVHLFLVYGGAHIKGPFASRAAAMTPFQVFLWIAGLALSMFSMAWFIAYLRSHHPILMQRARRSAILGAVILFLVLPYLTWWGVTLSFAAGTALVLALSRSGARVATAPVRGVQKSAILGS